MKKSTKKMILWIALAALGAVVLKMRWLSFLTRHSRCP